MHALAGSRPFCGLRPPVHNNLRASAHLLQSSKGSLGRPAAQAENSQDTAADLLAETEALLAGISTGAPAEPSPGYLSDDEGGGYRFEVSCDVNGCSIKPVPQDRRSNPGPQGLQSPVQPAAGPANFSYHEGPGWKIGFDETPENKNAYSAVIGSDNWSIAVTNQEIVDFIQLLKNLRRSVTTLEVCGEWGGAGEEATLEMETPRLWMQGRAPQQRLSTLQDYWRHGESSAASQEGQDLSTAFDLRFIIKTPGSREVEGQWNSQTVMSFLEFLDSRANQFLSSIEADSGLRSAAQEVLA